MLTGSCLCQAVKFGIAGRLGPAVFCHCRQSQKSNGTAFATTAPVHAKYFEIVEGRERIREYERSPGKFRAFCATCGSPIYSRRPADPNTLRIRLGTIDVLAAGRWFTSGRARKRLGSKSPIPSVRLKAAARPKHASPSTSVN